MDIETGRKRWQELYDKWEPINQAARQAQMRCIGKFQSGVGPTEAEMQHAEDLDRQAQVLRGQMDHLCRQVFGD